MTENQKPKPERPKAKSGPKANTLKLTGNWQAAIKQSLKKRKPPEGWPK